MEGRAGPLACPGPQMSPRSGEPGALCVVPAPPGRAGRSNRLLQGALRLASLSLPPEVLGAWPGAPPSL